MSRQNNAAPVIIKRKRVSGGGGHHGGAWKVAYADFVTAMMAFFLMMWLLGATTESQRRGLADYFSPTIPIHRIAAGGEGLFAGNDLQARDAVGPDSFSDESTQDDSAATRTEVFDDIVQRLDGLGGESALMAQPLRHVVTRRTDQGLIIELFDLPQAPLFAADSDEPMPVLLALTDVLSQVLDLAENPLAIEGHVRSYPIVRAEDPSWPLSMARATRMHTLLKGAGFDPARIARVTGHADRQPVSPNPMAQRNNRLELILLRRQD